VSDVLHFNAGRVNEGVKLRRHLIGLPKDVGELFVVGDFVWPEFGDRVRESLDLFGECAELLLPCRPEGVWVFDGLFAKLNVSFSVLLYLLLKANPGELNIEGRVQAV